MIFPSQVKNGSTTLASYAYDGLGREINGFKYYSGNQLIQVGSGTTSTATTQYVWSPVYINALIERDRDADNSTSTGTGGMEERLYAIQDANYNTTALTNTAGTVVERFQYDPYGHVTVLNADWTTNAATAGNDTYKWTTLFQGMRYDPRVDLTFSLTRAYSAELGRWISQDWKRYIDGANMYQMVGGNPIIAVDPNGFWSIVVDLPANRELPGTLSLYDNYLNSVIIGYPARGKGKYTNKKTRASDPWWKTSGDTPTGTWKGSLGLGDNEPNDTGKLGNGEIIRLSAQSGHAKDAVNKYGRFGFLIHGGRKQWLKDTTISKPIKWDQEEIDKPDPMPNPGQLVYGEYYTSSPNDGKIIHNTPSSFDNDFKTQLPANTEGCVRLTPENMRSLVSEIHKLIKNGENEQGDVIIRGIQEDKK